jgi:hypothetical protein
MFNWNDESNGDREAWRPDGSATELTFGDPDAWRGGVATDPNAWRRPAPAPPPAPAPISPPAVDPARPDVLEHGWPKADAGPEYLMWKERSDRE